MRFLSIPYPENARQPRDGFLLGPQAVPKCSYPTLRPRCHGSTRWSGLVLLLVFGKASESGNVTYGM